MIKRARNWERQQNSLGEIIQLQVRLLMPGAVILLILSLWSTFFFFFTDLDHKPEFNSVPVKYRCRGKPAVFVAVSPRSSPLVTVWYVSEKKIKGKDC